METDFLQIADSKGVYRIPFPEITHIESGGAYSTTHTSKGKKYTCCKNLTTLNKQLNGKQEFIRTHKSHIINKNQVVNYIKAKAVIILKNGTAIPLARRRRADFIEWMKKGDR